MTDQTKVAVEEQVWTDTGTGLYPTPGPVTIESDDGAPTGAVPPPPREVTTYDFPYDSEGNLMPTAKPVANSEAKQVTKAEVEDKAVKSSKRRS